MSESRTSRPPPPPPADDEPSAPDPRSEMWSIVRDIMISVGVVLLIGAILFTASGVWPPLVAVESDSMEDQIMTGDLVFIVEQDRFVGDAAVDGTGVVPADRGHEMGYERFDRPGDVIIFAPAGDETETPIIHRAVLWVETDEDWYERANPSYIGGADSCDELRNCPAPHDGFITHGDNNGVYDQIDNESPPVKPEWIHARAQYRVPLVGNLRLFLGDLFGLTIPGSSLVPT